MPFWNHVSLIINTVKLHEDNKGGIWNFYIWWSNTSQFSRIETWLLYSVWNKAANFFKLTSSTCSPAKGVISLRSKKNLHQELNWRCSDGLCFLSPYIIQQVEMNLHLKCVVRGGKMFKVLEVNWKHCMLRSFLHGKVNWDLIWSHLRLKSVSGIWAGYIQILSGQETHARCKYDIWSAFKVDWAIHCKYKFMVYLS